MRISDLKMGDFVDLSLKIFRGFFDLRNSRDVPFFGIFVLAKNKNPHSKVCPNPNNPELLQNLFTKFKFFRTQNKVLIRFVSFSCENNVLGLGRGCSPISFFAQGIVKYEKLEKKF